MNKIDYSGINIFGYINLGNEWYNSTEYVRGSILSEVYTKLLRVCSPFVSKKKSVIDIGCGYGYMSIPLSKVSDKVYSYESNEQVFNGFVKNIEYNAITNIKTYNFIPKSDKGEDEEAKSPPSIEELQLSSVSVVCCSDSPINYAGILSIITRDTPLIIFNSDSLMVEENQPLIRTAIDLGYSKLVQVGEGWYILIPSEKLIKDTNEYEPLDPSFSDEKMPLYTIVEPNVIRDIPRNPLLSKGLYEGQRKIYDIIRPIINDDQKSYLFSAMLYNYELYGVGYKNKEFESVYYIYRDAVQIVEVIEVEEKGKISPLECMERYKEEIINLSGNNEVQRKFMTESFTRWYLSSQKDYLFPLQNLVNKRELEFANTNSKHKQEINVSLIMAKSQAIHDKYKQIYYEGVDFDVVYEYIPGVINKEQEARLKKLYKGKRFENDKNELIRLYRFVGTDNIHLGMPPVFKGIELFGSPLNTHNNEYCSPFEIEKLFGSLGDFFNYSFHTSGMYLCNPPFDEELISRMADRLINELKTTTYQVYVIVTIPVWDSESQRKYKLVDVGRSFEGFTKIIKSGYVRKIEFLDKYKYRYYDYYRNTLIPASDTHFIMMSNVVAGNVGLDKMMKKWESFVP